MQRGRITHHYCQRKSESSCVFSSFHRKKRLGIEEKDVRVWSEWEPELLFAARMRFSAEGDLILGDCRIVAVVHKKSFTLSGGPRSRLPPQTTFTHPPRARQQRTEPWASRSHVSKQNSSANISGSSDHPITEGRGVVISFTRRKIDR